MGVVYKPRNGTIFRQAKTNWEIDLRPLLPRFVTWETVAHLQERLPRLILFAG